MDRAEVWKLEDDMMPTFTEQREIYPVNYQHHDSFSTDEQYGSSFSSSDTSYDDWCILSRRESLGMSTLDGLSSSRTSLGSNGSCSPVDGSIFYSLNSLNHTVRNELDEKKHLYVSPCQKGIQDHNMMNYDYSQVNDMYDSFELQHGFSGLPGMMFDNLTGLLSHDTTSPLPMASSPDSYVVPSQTFISEPYRPTTPKNIPRAVLGSPLEDYSQFGEAIKYFMSPREMHTQTPSSSSSSGSLSTSRRTPSSQTLESSVALHRIQSICGSRINKKSKRSPHATSKIDRVAKGQFRCDYPDCKSEHGFKRHEHLKRHKKTHVALKDLHCRFCTKKFQSDRSDNYRSHVTLHTTDRKGSRTKYFAEAILEVESWKKKDKASEKLGVPGEMYRASSRRVRPGAKFQSTLWMPLEDTISK